MKAAATMTTAKMTAPATMAMFLSMRDHRHGVGSLYSLES